jgi:hypothetical protein
VGVMVIIGKMCSIAIHCVLLWLAWMLLDLVTVGLRLVFVGDIRIALAPSMTCLWMNKALFLISLDF